MILDLNADIRVLKVCDCEKVCVIIHVAKLAVSIFQTSDKSESLTFALSLQSW